MLLHCLLCNFASAYGGGSFLTSKLFIPVGVGIREEIEDSARILITCFK